MQNPDPIRSAPPTLSSAADQPAMQRVVKVRRDYNSWVARETLEDYALRFTPRSARRWSDFRVANTAFGAASFLVLEAVGATLLVDYGFVNTFWAILVTGLIILLAGWPISVYAARWYTADSQAPSHSTIGITARSPNAAAIQSVASVRCLVMASLGIPGEYASG